MREFDFLDWVVRANSALPPSVTVPPGDDMAVVRISGEEGGRIVVSIGLSTNDGDAAARAGDRCMDAGRRAMGAATDSLLGAPGVRGLAAVVNILAPADLDADAARAFQEGLVRASADTGTPVVGGDLCVVPDAAGLSSCVCAVGVEHSAAAKVAVARKGRGLGEIPIQALACAAIGPQDAEASSRKPALWEPSSHDLLIACDAAIEGRHAPMGSRAGVVARKAVLRNLSDVAAMGNARPVAIAAGIFVSSKDASDAMSEVEHALREIGARWGAPLVACETHVRETRAPLAVCVAILAAKVRPDMPVARRCDARPGDGVYATGTIGGAWDMKTGLGRHLDFTPRIAAAHELLSRLGDGLGAMIDVSDGLGRDLGHIARSSGVSIDIDCAAIPVPAGVDPFEALGHGEDYELAFTARGDVPRSVSGIPVTRIGVVTGEGPAHAGRVRARSGDRTFDASRCGFEHVSSVPMMRDHQDPQSAPARALAFHLRDAAETEQIGEVLGDLLCDARRHPGPLCLLLSGDLGAGKTTFVRGLARGLGCDERGVASPTFTLRMDHAGATRDLAHIDAWRIGPDDLSSIGWHDLASSHAVVALEWPERLAGHLPARSVRISLEHAAAPHESGEPGRVACIDLGALSAQEAARIEEGLRLLVRAAPIAPPACPTCGRAIAVGSEAEGAGEAGDSGGGVPSCAPFCSRRCRMADLGDWLLMRHRIAGGETPEFDE